MITVSNRCQAAEVEGHPLLHAHHWLIDGQQGPVSPAVCKVCDCHREFSNSFVRGGFVRGGWPLKKRELTSNPVAGQGGDRCQQLSQEGSAMNSPSYAEIDG
jgi:hypothetical protein